MVSHDLLKRFSAGFQRFQKTWYCPENNIYEDLRVGQHPYALVIACSDSRVDPVLLLDATPGDLFVIRNVANLVPPYEPDSHHHGVSAALEYAVRHLHIGHIMVMGHAKCGGFTSLLEASHSDDEFLNIWMNLACRAKAEVDDGARAAGEAAFHTLNLPPAAPEVVETLGRLKHRQSWNQNVLDHSIEMAGIMGTLAGELGLDIAAARRIGLLHDIGKALPAEEGPHATAGAALLKRHGEREEIVHAVAAHHREIEPATLLAHLAIAADAITASRPGARTDQTRIYFERMGQLEQLALAVPGVDHAYAIQGGRELRVFVNAAALDDEAAASAARDIAARIRDGVAFPGQLRVVVVRETRCIEQVRQVFSLHRTISHTAFGCLYLNHGFQP